MLGSESGAVTSQGGPASKAAPENFEKPGPISTKLVDWGLGNYCTCPFESPVLTAMVAKHAICPVPYWRTRPLRAVRLMRPSRASNLSAHTISIPGAILNRLKGRPGHSVQ